MDINKLILKWIEGKTSIKEMEVLESWKNESEENVKALQALKDNPSLTAQLADYQEVDIDEAYGKVLNKIEKEAYTNSSTNYMKYFISFILIAIIIGGVLFLLNNESVEKQYIAGNEVKSHDLIDGSVVTIDRESRVTTLSDLQHARELQLEGRAYFKVEHVSEDFPFIVHAGDVDVEVTGTEFMVLYNDEAFKVEVYEGSVDVSIDSRKVSLTQGEQVQLINNDLVKSFHNDDNLLGWKTNTLSFKQVAITDILKSLAWNYGVKVSYNNGVSENHNCLISTEFSGVTFDTILKELDTWIDYSYEKGILNVISIDPNC